ncbi:MAG TPA: HEAT repeat domain-containing protein [bacterium]|nr:HEAT repeat domain-containing protein [bacterium]HPQ65861.1 HEAT repeat domain-containing protein [bacterium]
MKSTIAAAVWLFIASGAGAATPTATPVPISALIEQLRNDDSEVRAPAKFELVKRGTDAGRAALEALPGAPPYMEYDLIMVIHHTRYSPAAPALESLFQKTSDPRIKMAAAMTLCGMDRDYQRYQDFLVGFTAGDEASEFLPAMQMLGYIGDPRVVPVLKRIFYDSARPDQIRQAAIWDLSHTPVPESAEALVEILDDPRIDWFYKEIAIAGLRGLAAEPGMADTVNRLLEKIQGIPAAPGNASAAPGKAAPAGAVPER